jgi:hypothetical protein
VRLEKSTLPAKAKHAEVVDGHARGMGEKGVERLGFDDLQVLEGREADRDVADVFARANLGRNVAFDPVNRALADLLVGVSHERRADAIRRSCRVIDRSELP